MAFKLLLEIEILAYYNHFRPHLVYLTWNRYPAYENLTIASHVQCWKCSRFSCKLKFRRFYMKYISSGKYYFYQSDKNIGCFIKKGRIWIMIRLRPLIFRVEIDGHWKIFFFQLLTTIPYDDHYLQTEMLKDVF